MPLTADLVEQILAACRQDVGRIAAVLSQTLGTRVEATADKVEAIDYAGPAQEAWNGPGLLLVFHSGDKAAVAVLAAASGLIPDWVRSPDASAQLKLDQLANGLGAVMLPEGLRPERCGVGYVDHIAEAIVRGGLAGDAVSVQGLFTFGDKIAAMQMIWPATTADAMLSAAASIPLPVGPARKPTEADGLEQQLDKLPAYVRSLLRIAVPVSVQLATTRQPVSRVLNIGPGSIIQFSKNCEQPLTLCVGNQPIAEGEAVKVGEKFGIKLTCMVLPGERFVALRGKRSAKE